jgi:DNA-directed RNA polymerase specialized sigma24 family protein
VTDPGRPMRDRAAVADAIRGFTPLEWQRLRKAADHYAAIAAGMDADDLIQEAMTLALSGGRPWPADVPIMAFLIQCMRSIASGESRKARRRPQTPLAGHSTVTEGTAEPSDPAPDAQAQVIAKENDAARKARIIEMFPDDIEAQAIVEGIFAGMRGEDLRTLTDLDQTGYESKRRLIRRRLETRQGVKP